eukprot:COSAG05_NODE_9490_length_621_cov_0.762452_1_plen_82_part_00
MWQSYEKMKANKKLSERWRAALDTAPAAQAVATDAAAARDISAATQREVDQIQLELQEIRRRRATLAHEIASHERPGVPRN